jgi:serine/threonine protein kinase
MATGNSRPGELPKQFGRYRIVQKLGEGGMGTVYLAYDTQLGRQVALKVPQFTADDTVAVQRFYREARAAAMLQHPNICPVYDVGEINGILYLTMAYIEGKSLAHCVRPGHHPSGFEAV